MGHVAGGSAECFGSYGQSYPVCISAKCRVYNLAQRKSFEIAFYSEIIFAIMRASI